MKLTHYFRIISRKLLSNFETYTRILIILGVLSIFFLISVYDPSNIFFGQIKSVAGARNSKDMGVNVDAILRQAAEDAALGRISEARDKLKIVLVFEPNNIYANGINSNLESKLDEINKEISETLEIVNLQPNWKEAWVKLAELYDKTGNLKLAAEAREKARGLKTS